MRPVFLRDGEQCLQAAITTGGAEGCFGKGVRWQAELGEFFGCADAVLIKEQQATGWRAGDHANGLGTSGSDFSRGLILGERVCLPVVLVGAFIAVHGNKSPGVRELLELV